MYKNMGDYPKALSSYEKALNIRKQSLPPNHPSLASSYDNIGNVYKNMGDYPNALSSYEKALEIRKQSLSSDHPDLAMSYDNIGLLYEDMHHYSKARSFYERAVNIGQQALLSNLPNIQKYRNTLGRKKKEIVIIFCLRKDNKIFEIEILIEETHARVQRTCVVVQNTNGYTTKILKDYLLVNSRIDTYSNQRHRRIRRFDDLTFKICPYM
jgi:tetratricopeptide (TPR) repeat protein